MNYLKHKFCYLYFSSLIDLFLFIILAENTKSIGGYLKSISLESGEYFVIYKNSINIYNYEFSLNKIIYNFTREEKITDENEFEKKTKISDYKDNNHYYIISLIKGKYIFIYDYINNHLYKVDLILANEDYYDLIPYKIESTNLIYIIICNHNYEEKYITFYFCKICLSLLNSEYSIIAQNKYEDSSLDGESINCNIINNIIFVKNEGLVCFSYKTAGGKRIEARTFDISLNFTNKNYFSYDENIKQIKSITSKDQNNSIICFKHNNNKFYCLLFNINENGFKTISIPDDKIDSFEIYYFQETNQYIFINYKDKNYKIFVLNDNLSRVQIDSNKEQISISECYKIKGYSLVYSKINEKYSIITDCEDENGNFEIIFKTSLIEANYTNSYNFSANSDFSLYSTYIIYSSYLESQSTINNLTIDSSLIQSDSSILLSNYILTTTILSQSSDSDSFISYETIYSTLSYIDSTTMPTQLSNSDFTITSETIYSTLLNISSTFIISEILPSTLIHLNSELTEPNNFTNLFNNDNFIYKENQIIKNITNQNKEEIIENLEKIIDEIEIGKSYEIKREDFNLIIKPTNSTYLDSVTHVNFSKCEQILREKLNISSSRILTFLQMEIDNKNDKSLVNQVEYQVYDDNKNLLDLSLCNDTNIKIFYSLKDKSLDINSISSFKDSGIDIFNINDSFFNDICQSYSDSKNDIILEDRIKDIYQNYSLCDNGCTYNEFNDSSLTISCDCKVKTNISTNETNLHLEQLDNIDIDSNFGLIKCYNLVFSFKGKLNNIGFWIFLILSIAHIPILFCYFNKGIEPIKEYIIKEMKKNGYIKENNNKRNILKKSKTVKINKKKKITKKKTTHSPCPKHKKSVNRKKGHLNNSSSMSHIKSLDNKIINDINSNQLNIKYKKKDNNIINKKNNSKKDKKDKRSIKRYLSKKSTGLETLPTKGVEKNENNEKDKNNFNLCLININLNNIKEYRPKDSNLVLNNYTFEEAIKYDRRAICVIFYIYLLSKQAAFHAFLYKSPLELFPLRFCLLIFIISSDLALNAVFYLDDKISKKYRNAQNLFLFTFNNNITIILLSTLIGFIFMTLFTNLSNSSISIKDAFKKEEEKLRKNKKYIITEIRKREIVKEIEVILKKYKIKVIILIILEISFILFYWYYVTAFCHVFASTQISWLLNSFLSMLSRLFIELMFSLIFAKLYRMAVEANIACLYKIALFFYCFG